MALMRIGMLLGVVAAAFGAFDIPRLDVPLSSYRSSKVHQKVAPTVTWNNGGFDLVYQSQNGAKLMGRLGSGSIPSDLGDPTPCDSGAELCWTFNSQVSVNLTPALEGQCYSIEWQTELDTLGDCFEIDSAHWYGGAEVFEQSWPITGDTTQMGEGDQDMAYVTGDFFQKKFAGVMEPYWINSDGFGIRALRENPLFVAWNSSGNGQLCLNARYAFPYPPIDRQETKLSLRYLLCSTNDVKEMQLLSLSSDFWAKPRNVVDERMLTHPIWSTWARYKTLINQERVGAFAQQIRQYGFNDSQLEIDDRWEDCYGEHRFDTNKFPDPGAMVADLHDQGFRVTLWIHPFINAECPSFTLASEHVVRTTSGQPGLTNWWQGNSAGYFDFTRQSAADWWSARITKLSTDYGLDGFKIDAGETNWLPVDFDFTGLLLANSTPNGYSTAYARNMERFGKMTEIRSGWATQDVPIFTRMLDKGTHWGKENGLATLIPTLLHFSLIGYPFVLPDMIGGNGYDGRPGKELFVRWMQANVFMPTMQFSYTPWDYDDEVVLIAQKMTGLHYEYAPLIVSLANQATVDGTPINRPLWWLDPSDPVALAIDSEYLLGDKVLVAPVLEKGAVSRDIYLPVGTWKDEADAAHPTYTGPIWLRDYPAPLDTLPFFTRA